MDNIYSAFSFLVCFPCSRINAGTIGNRFDCNPYFLFFSVHINSVNLGIFVVFHLITFFFPILCRILCLLFYGCLSYFLSISWLNTGTHVVEVNTQCKRLLQHNILAMLPASVSLKQM